jgi:hypothetical protein
LASAVELFDQTDRCVREIARTSRPTCQRQGVEHLYRELSLALAAQRAEVAVALKAIRRGRRALNVYSSATFLRR